MAAPVGGNRAWLAASVLFGVSYWLARDAALPAALLIAWKGAGVALLAAFALARQHRQIALVLGLGALGDMLIEFRLEWGAAAFLLGHLIAAQLYLRHRRAALGASQKMTGLVLLVLTPLIAWQLTASLLVAVYALGLGAMAGSAWTSSFARYRVGIGAVLFVGSDLLIFARTGVLAHSAMPGLLIWPLYYFGQLLICIGVCNAAAASADATTWPAVH